MEERHLILISLVFSLVGLGVLFVAAEKIEVKTTQISEVEGIPLDSMVKVEGNVTNIVERKEMMIIEVDDGSGKVDLVFFEKVMVEKGWKVSAEGKVSLYKKDRQILVAEMRRVV